MLIASCIVGYVLSVFIAMILLGKYTEILDSYPTEDWVDWFTLRCMLVMLGLLWPIVAVFVVPLGMFGLIGIGRKKIVKRKEE